MIKVFKNSTTKMIYIGKTAFGPSEDFTVQQNGNLISIYRPNTDEFEVRDADFSLFVDKNDNTFANVNALVVYLNGIFTTDVYITEPELDAKLNPANAESPLSDVATSGNYSDLTNTPTSFPPAAHTHTKSEITDFQESDYATAAQGSLADSAVQPGDLSVYENSTQLNARDTQNRSRANHTGTQPASTVTGLSTVATSGSYDDLTDKPTIPSAAPVDSVNGQTGAVLLDKTDIGLANVDNTADADKPVSTAVSTALAGKANSAHTHVKAEITDFNDADYAPASHTHTASEITDFQFQVTNNAQVLANTAKISATGNELEAGDLKTINGESVVGSGDIVISGGTGGGITNDPDPQTNLAGTATLGDFVYDTTDNELQRFDGTNFVPAVPSQDTTEAVSSGSTLGLQQQLLAESGQPGLTVLAVGFTNTGKVQGVSLGDGNVVEVYANGTDFNNGTVLYREFMSGGEPICFTGLSSGAIITSTQGFYGFSEQLSGAKESPMPLLSYGLSFKSTFFFGFRNSASQTGVTNQSYVRVVNGPLESKVTLKFGTGAVVTGQENITVAPWGFLSLQTNGNTEYILESTNPIMACVHAYVNEAGDGSSRYYDSRLIMPLTNDGITWPRSGFVSAPYNNTKVEFFTRDNVDGLINGATGVSPGSPVDFDAAPPTGTGASDQDYEPDGATRVLATGLISAYSGADSAGLEASPLMPTSAMSQVVAQPLHIADNGDGGNSGVAIASPYAGTARVYEWDEVSGVEVLKYTVPLTRNGVTITSKQDQKHPAAGLVSNDAQASNTLVGALKPGRIIADVPITVVVQNGDPGTVPTIRSQNGTTTTSIVNDDDETLSLGVTPATLKAEITEGTDGILYKREVGTLGAETWSVA